jgi:hypothetical protein
MIVLETGYGFLEGDTVLELVYARLARIPLKAH